MQKQQIIDMAEKAGFTWSGADLTWETYICTEELEDFAKLVAKAKAEEIATELLKGPVNDTAASIAIWILEQE